MAAARLSSIMFALNATTFVGGSCGVAFICRVASMPSNTGIRRSMNTKCGCHARHCSTASCPLAASRISNPNGWSRATSKRRLSATSSATSSRKRGCPGASAMARRVVAGGALSAASANSTPTSQVNVAPRPTTLRAWMSPPINCANFRLMANPSPVPSCARRPAFVCVKASNRRVCSSGAMQGPVSSTSNRSRTAALGETSDAVMTRSATPPTGGVNLMALPSRLSRICRSFTSSARIRRGRSAAQSIVKDKPFCCALRLNNSRTSFSSLGRSTSFTSSVMRRASILERSKT